MEISNIYVHDAQLHRVVEDIKADTVTMEVDLPILERGEQQEPRLLVFDDAYNYQVFEQAWQGLVTILRRGQTVENDFFSLNRNGPDGILCQCHQSRPD